MYVYALLVIGIAAVGNNNPMEVKKHIKGRSILDWHMIRISSALRGSRREKCDLIYCIKEKSCCGFVIQKAPCKVGVSSEYNVIPWKKKKKYLPASVGFDRGRIVAY